MTSDELFQFFTIGVFSPHDGTTRPVGGGGWDGGTAAVTPHRRGWHQTLTLTPGHSRYRLTGFFHLVVILGTAVQMPQGPKNHVSTQHALKQKHAFHVFIECKR